ncbi:hypothetical protein ACS0TY_017988 [Phlomoides rotata]
MRTSSAWLGVHRQRTGALGGENPSLQHLAAVVGGKRSPDHFSMVADVQYVNFICSLVASSKMGSRQSAVH